MKNKFLLLPLFLMLPFLSNAQPFEVGTNVVNAGFGLGWSHGYLYSAKSSFPALNLSYERGFKEISDIGVLGLGGMVGFKRTTYNYFGKWSYTDFFLAARGALHMDLFNNEKLDTYGGLVLGFGIQSTNIDELYGRSSGSYLVFGPFAGVRYYFTNNFGVFGEVGYGTSILALGVSFKF